MLVPIDQLFDNIPSENPIIVAVSGGSDSIALLLLAKVWALKSGACLQAVTVDHGLRAEAAAEAAFVASVCAGLDIPHVILAWEGLKPSFGIQEAARQSRYSLIDDFAHEIGADIIMTGHTEDDQVETVLMRSSRNTKDGDGRGLAGMARQTWLYGGAGIVRPLLNSSRKQLREYLRCTSQCWVEDPTNEDDSYERVRIRKSLEGNCQIREKTLKFSKAVGVMRSLVSKEAANYLKLHVKALAGPVYVLDMALFNSTVKLDKTGFDPVMGLVIQALLGLAGGQAYFISRRRLLPLWEAFKETIEDKTDRRINMGGAIVEIKHEKLVFYRETRNLTSLVLEPGETAIWDGRLHIFNGSQLPVFIEAPSRQQISEYETLRGKPFGVKPRQALRSSPVIHVQSNGGGATPYMPFVEAAEHPKGLDLRIASPAIEHFCPQFDEPLAAWVRSLDQYASASLQP